MRIIGLDPSKTATGWSVWDKRDLIASGTIRSDDVGMFAEKLLMLLREWRPGAIAYEQAIRSIRTYGRKTLLPGEAAWVGPNAGQMVLLEVQGAVIGLATALDIKTLGVSASTWRAAILKDGKLSREIAKRRAKETCKALGLRFKSVDEAEAILIGLWASQSMEIKYWGQLP
jgi:hypothetical protein